MKAVLCFVFALTFVAAAVATATADSRAVERITPVQKVIELLENMVAKGQSDKRDEQVQYAAYKQFCDDTSVDKKRAIAEANEKIEMLKADIEKYIADVKMLTKEIAEHDADIAAWKGDIKAATKVRTLEKTDYDKLHKDYFESIDALRRAIAVLQEQAHDRNQVSFVQVSALRRLSLIPPQAKKSIEAFLAQDPQDNLAVSAPEAYGYEFQSHGVIEMLEKLLDEFGAKMTQIEKEEVNTQHAFDMLVQDLTVQIEQATADRTSKSETKAKKLEAKAEAESDLADTTAVRDADTKFLADLMATCEKKAADFESRQQLRAEELAAIQKAIEIISSKALAGNAEKHLPSLMQKGAVLASLRADLQGHSQARVVQYLRSRAGELGSRTLSALVGRIMDDPFLKVKKMIKDLLVRLMEEANDEAEHKGWCDTELSTNEQTRKEKTDAVETLSAEIDELEASIAKLRVEITELTEAVANLDAQMAESTKIRQAEKAKNEQTIADAQAAQSATAQALTVLKDFYTKAGEATALLQQQPEAPEIFDSPYQGMQGESGGVVGMLEVIESDFARLEAETRSSEAAAQKEYDSFMTDAQEDKAAKEIDIEDKTAKKQDETQAHTVKKKDLAGTQKELEAALAYFDKLKPSCVDAGVSYEDRVARREAEIQSLQEALKILNGEDLAA